MSRRPVLVGAPGKVTDTYTAQDLGIGSVDLTKKKFSVPVGAIREENGRRYQLLKANAAIAVNAAVTFTLADTALTTVEEADATTEHIVGVAETAIASGEYGWVTIEGLVEVKHAATQTAGLAMGASAAAGIVAAPANTVVACLRMISVDGNAAGATAVATAFLLPGA